MTICDRCGVKDNSGTDVRPTNVVTIDDCVQHELLSMGDLCQACRDALLEAIDAWQADEPLPQPLQPSASAGDQFTKGEPE